MTIKSILLAHREEIVKDYEAGVGTRTSAKRFGCNCGSIWYFLRDIGVAIRQTKGKGIKLADYEVLVRQKHTAGLSAYRISLDIGVDKRTVLRWFARLGLSTSEKSTWRDDKVKNHAEEIVQLYHAGLSTNEIADKLGTGGPSIWKVLKSKGTTLRKRAIYECDQEFFDRIDNEDKAYLLGWFYSDGNNLKNSQGIRLQIADQEILEYAKAALRYTGPILLQRLPRKPHHKTIYGLTVNSKRLSQGLTALGCPANKTFLLRFPEEAIVPHELRCHFVRGYFDGDGSFGCYGKQRRWNVQIVGTKEIVEGIPRAAGLLTGFGYVQRYPERQNNNWTIQINTLGSIRLFLRWLYADATICLERKRQKYLDFLQEDARRCIGS